MLGAARMLGARDNGIMMRPSWWQRLSDTARFDGTGMTGGIMPKLVAMRWPIGIIVALLLIAGVSLSWGSSHPSRVTSPLSAISSFFTGGFTGDDEYGGELRELQFLRTALHRIEAELKQQANGLVLASLRTEQEAVMQRVREVARRVPADSLPPDIMRLIAPETAPMPAPEPAPGIAASPIGQAAPVRQAGELRVGLRPPSPVADFSSLARAAPLALPVFIQRPQPRRAAPSPSTAAADRAETRPSSR
jgi:hypothetical protein